MAGKAQGWVQKPFNENLLLAELGRVLRNKEGPGQILLVDQDQELAAVILAGFRDAGVRIDHACTLQQAVDRCLLGHPDLLMIDLTLPDGDGFSLVDWLRRQPSLHMLPLVVYSNREVTEAEMTKLRLGPTQFFNKSTVQPREVEELVLAMVSRLRSPAGTPVGTA
jgi:DNA-binding response OmpR family regulator